MYILTIIHINMAPVTDTHKEKLMHSLGLFYKCYNLQYYMVIRDVVSKNVAL